MVKFSVYREIVKKSSRGKKNILTLNNKSIGKSIYTKTFFSTYLADLQLQLIFNQQSIE